MKNYLKILLSLFLVVLLQSCSTTGTVKKPKSVHGDKPLIDTTLETATPVPSEVADSIRLSTERPVTLESVICEYADNEVAAQSMVNLDQMVRQPQTQQMPQATMQQPPAANMSSLQTTNPLTYQALFPNDPTGQMLTQRGQNART